MPKRMCSAASLCQVRGDVALRSLLRAKSPATSVIKDLKTARDDQVKSAVLIDLNISSLIRSHKE